MKMCKYFGSAKVCPRDLKGVCLPFKRGKVNVDCEIKSRPKPKTRTFKAWAKWSETYSGYVAIEDTSDMSITGRFPCTITIEAKYLKGEK